MRINSIGSNFYAGAALRKLNEKQQELDKTFARLASGKILPKDRPTAVAISERLSSQATGYDTANRNIQLAAGSVATAEGALASISDDLMRMRELAVQAANGTYSNADRGLMNGEFNQLRESIDDTATQTNFNGTKLIDGSFSSSIQVGPNSGDAVGVEFGDARASNLGLNDISIDTQEDAEDAIEQIDAALDEVYAQRAQVSAVSTGLESTYYSNSVASENLQTAASNLTDVDFISEIAALSLEKIQTLAALKALKIQDENEQTVLDLLAKKVK